MTARQKILATLAGVAALLIGVLATRVLTPPHRPSDPPQAGERPTSRPDPRPEPPALATPRYFARDSVWNAKLTPDAELDPKSPSLMAAFNRQIAAEREKLIGPWIATDDTSTPVYEVGASQQKVGVQLQTGPWGAPLQAALDQGVPIPDDARPAAGPDRHMTIYQRSTDTLWEFWRAQKRNGRWTAEWGGVMRGASRSPGYFTERSFPGSARNWGATATSLPVVGGTMMIADLERGRIDHALALNVPDARKGVFSWPAQRSDGDGGPNTLPEGARLRLDPDVDVPSLGLSPMGEMMALAAQRHGIIIRDVTHHATGFFAEDPTPTGRDPYRGRDGYFRGTPADVLKEFPFHKLQLLRMDLCSSAPCEPG